MYLNINHIYGAKQINHLYKSDLIKNKSAMEVAIKNVNWPTSNQPF